MLFFPAQTILMKRTRRFLAQAASVWPGSIGISSPLLRVAMRSAAMPFLSNRVPHSQAFDYEHKNF